MPWYVYVKLTGPNKAFIRVTSDECETVHIAQSRQEANILATSMAQDMTADDWDVSVFLALDVTDGTVYPRSWIPLISLILLCMAYTAHAAPIDGIRVSAGSSDYAAFEGTRQEGILIGTMGPVKTGDSYGLHLSIGPVYRGEGYTAAVVYGAGFNAALWHEAEAVVTWRCLGLAYGHGFEHRARLPGATESGMGDKSFVRASLSYEVGQ